MAGIKLDNTGLIYNGRLSGSQPAKNMPISFSAREGISNKADASNQLRARFNDHNLILSGKKNIAFGAYTGIDPIEQNCIEIYKNVMPSVVRVDAANRSESGDEKSGLKIFNEETGQGSGSIIDRGLVITNYHVVRDNKEFSVKLNNGKEAAAMLIGAEPSKDLALLKIVGLSDKELDDLPVIKKGDSSDVVGGQRAFVLGSPLGNDRTLTVGVVSATGREIETNGGDIVKGVIQTDASINSGNSGGPLVNSRGEQIGVMFQALTGKSDGDIGINYAIPMNTVMEVVEKLKANRTDDKPYIGFEHGFGLEEVPEQARAFLGLNNIDGVIIDHLNPEGPAMKAGLKELNFNNSIHMFTNGTIITKINGKNVSSFDDIKGITDKLQIGSELNVEYINFNADEEILAGLTKGTAESLNGPLLKLSEPATVTYKLDKLPEPVLKKPLKPEGKGPVKHIKIH